MTKSRGLVPLVKVGGSGGGQETCFHQNCLHPTNTRKSSAIMEGGAGARTWRKARRSGIQDAPKRDAQAEEPHKFLLLTQDLH